MDEIQPIPVSPSKMGAPSTPSDDESSEAIVNGGTDSSSSTSNGIKNGVNGKEGDDTGSEGEVDEECETHNHNMVTSDSNNRFSNNGEPEFKPRKVITPMMCYTIIFLYKLYITHFTL